MDYFSFEDKIIQFMQFFTSINNINEPKECRPKNVKLEY